MLWFAGDTTIADRRLTPPSPKEKVLKRNFRRAKLKSSPLERIIHEGFAV
jgi:hypothetical protein